MSAQRRLDPLAARGDRAPRAAGVLDAEREHRPARRFDRAREPPLVEALAAERDEQRAADVGMRAELLHHPERVGIRVAAGEADEMHAALAKRRGDLARDVVRALDQVGDDEDVAHALAAVGAEVALQHHASSARSCRQHVGRQVVALDVVRVHVFARRDPGDGGADRAVVLEDDLAFLDRPRRELVADGDVAADRDRDAVERDGFAGLERAQRDGDVVPRRRAASRPARRAGQNLPYRLYASTDPCRRRARGACRSRSRPLPRSSSTTSSASACGTMTTPSRSASR